MPYRATRLAGSGRRGPPGRASRRSRSTHDRWPAARDRAAPSDLRDARHGRAGAGNADEPGDDAPQPRLAPPEQDDDDERRDDVGEHHGRARHGHPHGHGTGGALVQGVPSACPAAAMPVTHDVAPDVGNTRCRRACSMPTVARSVQSRQRRWVSSRATATSSDPTSARRPPDGRGPPPTRCAATASARDVPESVVTRRSRAAPERGGCDSPGRARTRPVSPGGRVPSALCPRARARCAPARWRACSRRRGRASAAAPRRGRGRAPAGGASSRSATTRRCAR